MNARDDSKGGTVRKGYVRPLDIRHGRIDMGHGAGGRAAAQLIDEIFLAAFDNPWLRQGNDGAAFAIPAGQRMVMATDGHVISPLFFPGGDIGALSVHGTVNDVAMMGATPLYLAASFILEEGFPLADLKRIVQSMAAAAREAGVPVITGDTKVVEQGKGDGVFISTTGVGVVPHGIDVSGANARAGRRHPAVRHHRRPRCGRAVAARVAGIRDDHRVGHRSTAHAGRRDAGRVAGHPRAA
jgi:hydrogenase expression/formation protein HypE